MASLGAPLFCLLIVCVHVCEVHKDLLALSAKCMLFLYASKFCKFNNPGCYWDSSLQQAAVYC